MSRPQPWNSCCAIMPKQFVRLIRVLRPVWRYIDANGESDAFPAVAAASGMTPLASPATLRCGFFLDSSRVILVLPGRLALAPPSSFELLAKLLQGADPQAFPIGNAPVAMTVGEPRDAPPP